MRTRPNKNARLTNSKAMIAHATVLEGVDAPLEQEAAYFAQGAYFAYTTKQKRKADEL